MLCHYWYFKDVGFKFELHVCNKCHDVLMTADELNSIAILNVKVADFRCTLCGIMRLLIGLIILCQKIKVSCKMDFGANKTPVEVIKQVRLEEHISETFILVLMESGTKNHGKNLNFLFRLL